MLGKLLQISVIGIFVALGMANGLKYYAAKTAQTKMAKAAPQAAPTPIGAVKLAVRRNEVRLPPDARGQYLTDVEINGSRIGGMMVDTGASTVALSYEDAAAIGIFPAPADYKYSANTANGVARLARATLREVRVGEITVYDVDAFVGERGALSGGSLLGMTFLSKLSRFEVDSGTLVLKQ
ncbi:MAG: TIGR02281 family clan AA aspartic protease [Methylocystis sp.]|nr:TIGR02281 family clan AA aspartic protease [Methylocystis sp.]